MPNNKSLGTDGFPPDFYKMFWPKIKDLYLQVVHEAIQKGRLHLTVRRGIISLLEKAGKNKQKLKFWRPIAFKYRQ